MTYRVRCVLTAVTTTVLVAACAGDRASAPVSTHVSGVIEIRADADSVPDYSGFVVAIMSDGADTLAITETDATGAFGIDVHAPRKAIYSMLVSRHGRLLKQGEIVLAEGDSASVRLRLPDGGRPLMIRSLENAALMAYRNTRSMHASALKRLVATGDASLEVLALRYRQTAELLWSLRTRFPGTIGADIAGSESVILLEGWNDTLVVARAESLAADTWNYDNVVRAVRRSKSRLAGLDGAIALLREMQNRTSEEGVQAVIESEIVAAYFDSSRYDDAATAAEQMQRRFRGTTWEEWAKSAQYEMQSLSPGKPAPVFAATTWDGYPFDAAEGFDGLTLLEFVKPLESVFLRELDARDALTTDYPAGFLNVVTVSVDPDSVVNEALFDEHMIPGSVAIALPDGSSSIVARLYNVKLVPKRFLILDGTIVAKYSGAAIAQVRRDLNQIAGAQRPPL